MNTWSKWCCLSVVVLLLAGPAVTQGAPALDPVAGRVQRLLGSLALTQPGKQVVTVIMQASEAAQLFPADPKTRAKADFQAILADGRRAFLGVIAPGGQSSLTCATPNLRVSKLDEIVVGATAAEKAKEPVLCGVPVLDKTLRLNPMTMDEGYVNTLLYLELLNRFRLLPHAGAPLAAEYAKVVYRFLDGDDRWVRVKNPLTGAALEALPAGLHLVNEHPVKYLKACENDQVEVVAVARSRYNVLNHLDRIKKVFGKREVENPDELFSANDVKDLDVVPFRVEIKWADKNKAEKSADTLAKNCANGALLRALLTRAYAAPRRFAGEELVCELEAVLDLEQLFRFMAINRLLENGDISDEFFWYVERDKKSGAARLGILPQDGDDMFKGAHFFPTNPKQIGLILKGSTVARRLGLSYGYIMNYEDPLFRVVRDDPVLFARYLATFAQMAASVADPGFIDPLFAQITQRIAPYTHDADVLDRGQSDARGAAYTPDSFSDAAKRLRERVCANAAAALASLRGTAQKPGDLAKARAAAAH